MYRNIYSVHSRLIGERVDVRLYADHLEVWFAGRVVQRTPRLRGQRKHLINYRHVIDWLVRKPGEFENYQYRDDLFPTSRFRMAYDALRNSTEGGFAGVSPDPGTGGSGKRVAGGRRPAGSCSRRITTITAQAVVDWIGRCEAGSTGDRGPCGSHGFVGL